MTSPDVELSVLVPLVGDDDGDRAAATPLLKDVSELLAGHGISHECLQVRGERYGDALAAGFEQAHGGAVLTLDHDFVGELTFILAMWAAGDADLVIASRYAPGGRNRAPLSRRVISATANRLLRPALSLDVHDMSSGYRLYRASAMKGVDTSGMGYEALHDVVVHLAADGAEVVEVPFDYRVDAAAARARVGLGELGTAVLRSLPGLRTLRTSVAFADYDSRAYDSRIPFQRWWQRSRHRIVTSMAAAHHGGKILDVGCGSSRILGALPGRDRPRHPAVASCATCATTSTTPSSPARCSRCPFRDGEFDCVVCSQVIEHVPTEPSPITELLRVLDPAGTLVLGTPDYGGVGPGRRSSASYGFVRPNAYADEHISHYTRDSMLAALDAAGWECTGLARICRAEMIATFRRRHDGRRPPFQRGR